MRPETSQYQAAANQLVSGQAGIIQIGLGQFAAMQRMLLLGHRQLPRQW
jgi:hypothetical protein